MGLKKLKGATNVTVSLNQGQAIVQLASRNTVAIEDIRRVVSRNGFTPKEARVSINGELTRGDGKPLLVAGRKAQHRLVESAEAPEKWRQLQAMTSGQMIQIKGKVRANSDKSLSIEVLDFSLIPKQNTS